MVYFPYYMYMRKGRFITIIILVLAVLSTAGLFFYIKVLGYNLFSAQVIKGGYDVISGNTNQSSLSVPTTPIETPTSPVTTSPAPVVTTSPPPVVVTTSPPAVVGVTDATGETFYGRGTANNKIGMYVNNNVDDIKAAAKLINSNGGKWGYVLLTMTVNDRNTSGWQDLFDAASKSQLIPIVQLYNNGICDPKKLDFKGLANTLNSVKWPSSRRYISVFNEVNSKDYWCENISPDQYAKALDNAISAFKAKSSKFFIMPAAFNSSARTQDRYMSEDTFLVKMNQAVPGIFKKIDGWATHSYPQPNFSGNVYNLPAGYGARDTINNYTWEMAVLKNNFGINGLPIFITETGWLHKEGQDGCEQYSQSNLLSADTVATRYKDAYLNFWLKDTRIVAITPFIFRSPDKCAKGFAWQKSDGSWYPQATMLLNMKKTAGAQ